jgi:hypothetical protein
MHEDEIQRWMGYHPPSADLVKAHEDWRQVCITTMRMLNHMLPDGREKAVATTHLEDVLMWGNKAIACHVPAPGPGHFPLPDIIPTDANTGDPRPPGPRYG